MYEAQTWKTDGSSVADPMNHHAFPETYSKSVIDEIDKYVIWH